MHVDFLAVMTYDEHYSGSPSAGSVASLPWVIDAIEATLEEVPAEKVYSGFLFIRGSGSSTARER